MPSRRSRRGSLPALAPLRLEASPPGVGHHSLQLDVAFSLDLLLASSLVQQRQQRLSAGNVLASPRSHDPAAAKARLSEQAFPAPVSTAADDDDVCAVCLEPMEPGQSLVAVRSAPRCVRNRRPVASAADAHRLPTAGPVLAQAARGVRAAPG